MGKLNLNTTGSVMNTMQSQLTRTKKSTGRINNVDDNNPTAKKVNSKINILDMQNTFKSLSETEKKSIKKSEEPIFEAGFSPVRIAAGKRPSEPSSTHKTFKLPRMFRKDTETSNESEKASPKKEQKRTSSAASSHTAQPSFVSSPKSLASPKPTLDSLKSEVQILTPEEIEKNKENEFLDEVIMYQSKKSGAEKFYNSLSDVDKEIFDAAKKINAQEERDHYESLDPEDKEIYDMAKKLKAEKEAKMEEYL